MAKTKLTTEDNPKEILYAEVEILRDLLRQLLSRRALERAFVAKQLRSLRRRWAYESARRKQAYANVARLRSELGEARVKLKNLEPLCSQNS